MSEVPRRRSLDGLLAVFVGSAAFSLYVATLAPTVLAGDPGEFQFVPYLLGVAHPTGYPLYCLLGWIWSHLLPLGDPSSVAGFSVAYRLNLFSAFWAALAVGLLYPTARLLLRQACPNLPPVRQRLLAALAAATFAVTPTFWSQAVIAEVYGLHTFFLVLLLYLLLTFGEKTEKGPWRYRHLLPTAFCFGLSLTHHRTTLLLAPALLAYGWRRGKVASDKFRSAGAPRAKRHSQLVAWGLLLIACCLPLLLYLYIPLRAPHASYLRQPLAQGRELVLYENALTNFVDFILGGPFGGSLDFSVDLGARLAMAWRFLHNEIGWLGVVLALIGAARLAASRKWALLALTGLTYVATVTFNLVYTIGDIYVLFIPSYLVVVLWLTVGVGSLAQASQRLLSRQADGVSRVGPVAASRGRVVGAGVVLLFFTLPMALAATHYADIDQSQRTSAHTRWETILSEPPPPDAVLVSNDRNNIMPLWYFQYVDGRRTDLLGLFPLITPEYPTLGHVLDLAMSTGRPVYLIKEMTGVEVKVALKAEGKLWRVLGPAIEGEPAYSSGAQLADAVALAGYDRSPRSPHPGETLRVDLYWESLRPLDAEYHTFVHLLDATGQKVAQSDRQPGGVYYPTTLWQPDERLRDEHHLPVPADAPPGVYQLLVGMYAFSDDGTLIPLGEPFIVGTVGVKTSLQTEPGPISHPARADFAGQIELLGYDTTHQEETLAVTLHWRCLEPPTADYVVFVHLLDAAGNLIAQHDGQPRDGTYPTSVWDTDEVATDEHALSLPPDLPPGDYRLRVGLYRLETGERLPVAGNGDSVELGPVEVR